jgi:membrane associated rhomboid family serine protease
MQTDELTAIWHSAEREHCSEFALVLASQAIEAQVHWDGRSWVLSVPAGSAAGARRELAAYAAESRAAAAPRVAAAARGLAWPGALVYVLVIVVVALVAPRMAFGPDWFVAGRIDGARLAAGEWWRTITALTLHADAAHLLGNACFGAFFGYSVARYLGGGFGWLLIVACGALGNLANGTFSGAGHRSIGASTAVFAALGILSAYLWRRGFPAAATRRERIAPLVAGIGLLAFTGAGGVNTDIGAHLFGYVAGFGGGLAVARLGFPSSRAWQLACGAGAFGLVAAAWIAALR